MLLREYSYGRSSIRWKVLEFRKFKKDNIGLYQINTNYINGDEDNNIARSSITNITEAFIESFSPVAQSDNSILISVNKFFMSKRLKRLVMFHQNIENLYQ